jgi:hypothetical protein
VAHNEVGASRFKPSKHMELGAAERGCFDLDYDVAVILNCAVLVIIQLGKLLVNSLLGTGRCFTETLYGPSKTTAFMVSGKAILGYSLLNSLTTLFVRCS